MAGARDAAAGRRATPTLEERAGGPPIPGPPSLP